MRVFVAAIPEPVSPLDAPARKAMVLGRTLEETMARELARAGLEIVPVVSLAEGEDRARREPEGAFVVADSVIASGIVLRRFAAAAKRMPGETSQVCALPRGLASDQLSHIGGLDALPPRTGTEPVWTAPLYFLRGPGSAMASAAPLVLPYKEQVLRLPTPVGIMGGPEHLVGISESYLCNVSHWAHVLRVNTAATAGWWFERLRWGVVLGPAWVAWRMLRGFPWMDGRLAGALNHTAWTSKVHHTAHLELSVVERDASVGPLASVRNSFIGEGAIIGEGARLFGAVIGKKAFVAANSVVTGSVVYPGAFAGQLLMQASLLGEHACAFTNSNFFDMNFTRNIRVSHRGRFVDSGSRFLGVCVGPQARVSAGVWIASGREVPRGALIVKPTGEAVHKIGEPEAGVAYAVRDGALMRLDER